MGKERAPGTFPHHLPPSPGAAYSTRYTRSLTRGPCRSPLGIRSGPWGRPHGPRSGLKAPHGSFKWGGEGARHEEINEDNLFPGSLPALALLAVLATRGPPLRLSPSRYTRLTRERSGPTARHSLHSLA